MMLLAAAVMRSPFLTIYFGFLNFYLGSGSLLIICGTFSLGLYSTWGQVRCALPFDLQPPDCSDARPHRRDRWLGPSR